jgi:hypothetical protein
MFKSTVTPKQIMPHSEVDPVEEMAQRQLWISAMVAEVIGLLYCRSQRVKRPLSLQKAQFELTE